MLLQWLFLVWATSAPQSCQPKLQGCRLQPLSSLLRRSFPSAGENDEASAPRCDEASTLGTPFVEALGCLFEVTNIINVS